MPVRSKAAQKREMVKIWSGPAQAEMWFGSKPQAEWSPDASVAPKGIALELRVTTQFNPFTWVKDLLSRPKTAREVDAPVKVAVVEEQKS